MLNNVADLVWVKLGSYSETFFEALTSCCHFKLECVSFLVLRGTYVITIKLGDVTEFWNCM